MPPAAWNGAVPAKSDRCRVVLGNACVPPGAVRRERLREGPTHTACSRTGEARRSGVVVGGQAGG